MAKYHDSKATTLAIGVTGIKTHGVSPGRTTMLSVVDSVGDAVYDVVGYLMTAEEDASRNLCVIETGLSGEYIKASVGGFVEVGIQITSASTGTIRMETLGCKQS